MTDPADDLTNLLSATGVSPAILSLIDERLSDLVNAVFDEVEDQLEAGDERTKQNIIRTILPLVIRARQGGQDETDISTEEMLEEVRAAFQEAGAELRDTPVDE